MSSEEQDFPYTWEATQNSKGFFQIRFKMKSEILTLDSETKSTIKTELTNIKNAVEEAGFKVQETEPIKEKKSK